MSLAGPGSFDGASLEKQVASIRKPWVASRYYTEAEKWTHLFWDKQRPFRSLFDTLKLGTVVDLACGYGRHAENCAPLAEKLILVDVIEENLGYCRDRLAKFGNVEFRLGTGVSFPDFGDASVDAVYCYDAMVHFSPDIIKEYLHDTARVLKPGGRALYHHSNYAEGKGKVWSQNPHARNYMTVDLFSQLAADAGLDVLEQRVIAWGGVDSLDGITLMQRPVNDDQKLGTL